MRARLLSAVLIFCSLPAFAAITGTVVDFEGKPVVAKVTALALESFDARRTRVLSADPARKPLATAQCDSKGNFTIEAAKGSVVDLRFDAAGFAPQIERAASDDDAGVIQLSPAQMKQGTITANGKALAGATVIVAGDYGEIISTTDEKGHYPLPDPAHVNSRIIVRHPDYAIVSQVIGRVSGMGKADIALEAGSSLTGRVVAEDGQTAVSDAVLLVDDFPVATSTADGTFTIAHLAKKWERIDVRSGNRLASRVYAKEVTSPLTMRLARAASLNGTIRDAKTQLPLSGAEVRLISPGRFVQTGAVSAISDAKGNYSISGIAGGDYEIAASRPNYAAPNVSLHLAQGQSAQKALYGTPEGRISGTVLDEDHKGVAGTRLETRTVGNDSMMPGPRMRMIDRGRTNITAPDGHFLVRVEGENELQIDATKKGLPSAHSNAMKVAAGERKSGVTITIPRGVPISGRVADAKGKPLSGVSVTAAESRPAGGGPGNIRRMVMNSIFRGDDDLVRTASDGTFTLRVKEGSYDLSFKREGYAGKTLRAQQIGANAKPVDVTLEPGVEISGRITRGGNPVEGVNVISINSDSMLPVQTGPDGTFRLVDQTPGEMMLAFSKREEFIQLTRAVNAPANDVNIDLPPGGRVIGRVVDKATHAPVKSFEAGISGTRGGGGMVMVMPPSLQSFTSEDGSFVLENVPAGSQTLTVNAPGYVQTRVPNLSVENGKAVENIEVSMETGVRITGHVTGPDGAPVGSAVVRIDPMAGGRMMRGGGMSDPYTVTDPSGEYTLENVEPGEKSIVFSATGLISTTKSVTLSGDHAQVDAQLSSGVRVSGVVVNEGGSPVADAVVHTSSASNAGFGRTAHTDAGGSFSFDGLAPGHYEFQAAKTGYADAMLRDYDVSTSVPVRLTLHSGGTITGHVNGLTATELQYATVHASTANGDASSPVDSNGNYRIDGAPIGTVRVDARAGQMLTSMRWAPAKSVQVDAGSSVTVDFDFTNDITISGRVTRDGSPLAGMMVNFSARNSSMRGGSVATDSNGHYEMAGLDNGDYNVRVFDPNRGPYMTQYTVSGSGTFNIDIRGVSVRGRVTNATTGEPLADATVSLRRIDGQTNWPLSMASVDAGGNFTFDSVPAGSFRATAEKKNFGGESVNVTVTDSGADPIELKLAPSEGLTILVVDARDNRPINAWYRAVSANGTVYDDFLRFTMSNPEAVNIPLAAGSYKVTLGAEGYAAQSFTINAPATRQLGLTPGGTILFSSSSAELTNGRLLDATGTPYPRGGMRMGQSSFGVVADPLQTTLQNIAPGQYTLQLLDDKGAVVKSTIVNVGEGRTITVKL